MDDTDTCLCKGATSVLSDPAVIARRKRMEIRRFKKLSATTTQLLHDNVPPPISQLCLPLKRAHPSLLSHNGESEPSDEDLQDSLTSQLPTRYAAAPQISLPTQDAAAHLSPPQSSAKQELVVGINSSGFPLLDSGGILGYKYLLPEANKPLMHVSKVHCTCSGAVESGLGAIPAASPGELGHSESNLLREYRAGLSSLNSACGASLHLVPLSMVDVSEQLESKGLKAGVATDQDASVSQIVSEDLAPQLEAELKFSGKRSPGLEGVLTCEGCPSYGKVHLCGRRREMEDAIAIAPYFTQMERKVPGMCLCKGDTEDQPMCDLHFFAVYDGHGGSQASKFCQERLHYALTEELISLLVARCEGASDGSLWVEAMVSCFSKMDREVKGVLESSAMRGEDCMAPENVGTTAVVAVVSVCQIVLAHCGDSRAVLSRGGKAFPLTADHKPERGDERNRIEAASGSVIYWDGYSVDGLLALSRAIGDRYLKQFAVSEPEVTCVRRAEEDECLIIASDGLWGVMSNDTACEIAVKCLGSYRHKREVGNFGPDEDPAASTAAALLVKLAYARGSKDNISVVVVDLKS